MMKLSVALKIALGFHAIARASGHLWGQLPRDQVAAAVAALGPDVTAEAIARVIREMAEQLPCGLVGGVFGPEARDNDLVLAIGGQRQLMIFAHWRGFMARYFAPTGAQTTYKSRWYEGVDLREADIGEWEQFGGEPRPRDYARIVWALEVADWLQSPVVPLHDEEAWEEYHRYRQLGHKFGAGHILAAPDGGAEEPDEPEEAMA
jgi:hypothetical protein